MSAQSAFLREIFDLVSLPGVRDESRQARLLLLRNPGMSACARM